LPSAVLFPGAKLPLHIFEPRYRAMMSDVLAGGSGLMVIAQLKPGWQREYAGQPPIAQVAGLGRIETSQHNADGTYDLELLGLTRVQLDELPMGDKPYRRAKATPLAERGTATPHAGRLDAELASVFSLASQIAVHVRKREPRFRLLATPNDAPGLMLDKLADQLVGDGAQRQRLLETLDVSERLQALTTQIAQLQLTLLAGEDGGAVVH
jgi:Lon protease-like protein